jgi:inositol transport system permease protein
MDVKVKKDSILKKIRLEQHITILVLIGMCVILTVVKPQFISPSNLFTVFQQACIYGILAPGATLIIISGGIDLSAGAMLALTGVAGAVCGQLTNAVDKIIPWMPQFPFIVPILATLFLGLLCGGINGLIIAKAGIPPFIATLGMTSILRGLAFLISGGRPVSNVLPGYGIVSYRIFNLIPFMVIVFLLSIVLCHFLLNNTKLGVDIYAVGGNVRSAVVSGIRVNHVTIVTYAIAGLLYAVAAIVMTGKAMSIQAGTASGYELTAIAASIIGGVSPTGGVGTIGGILVGIMIISVLRNGLTILGIGTFWQQVAEGLVILVACLADVYRTHNSR